MTREECEWAMLNKLHEIYDIYHQYNAEGEYLSLSVTAGKHFSANNAYYGEDNEKPLNAWEDEEYGFIQGEAVTA